MLQRDLAWSGTEHCMVRNITLHVGSDDDMSSNGTLHARNSTLHVEERIVAR